jgi:hypothetical protein
MCWVPDAREVYEGVARVLRTGGTYRVDFANPATEFMELESWDGEGYRITVPYAETTWVEHPSNGGPDCIQFRHHMGSIFNGLLGVGLAIQHVQDSPEYFGQDVDAVPGSWEHWLRYCGAFAIVAVKE